MVACYFCGICNTQTSIFTLFCLQFVFFFCLFMFESQHFYLTLEPSAEFRSNHPLLFRETEKFLRFFSSQIPPPLRFCKNPRDLDETLLICVLTTSFRVFLPLHGWIPWDKGHSVPKNSKWLSTVVPGDLLRTSAGTTAPEIALRDNY